MSGSIVTALLEMAEDLKAENMVDNHPTVREQRHKQAEHLVEEYLIQEDHAMGAANDNGVFDIPNSHGVVSGSRSFAQWEEEIKFRVRKGIDYINNGLYQQASYEFEAAFIISRELAKRNNRN